MELQMLLLFEDSQFGAAIVTPPWRTGQLQLTPNPRDACDTVLADGFDIRLLVPQTEKRGPSLSKLFGPRHGNWISLEALSSGMRRVARDGEAYDLFEFAV
eukprot:4155529-Pyramimonas_sp.AAC.1